MSQRADASRMPAVAGCVVQVRLTPRGGRDAVEGVDEEGRLRVRVAAPAVEGAANRALVRLLAESLGLAPSAVTLEAGATSRVKRLLILGRTGDEVRARWPGVAILESPGRAIGSVG